MKDIPNRLSPVDHVFTGRGAYPINFVFVYDGLLDSVKLQKSLDEVLGDFFPLSSRLKVHDEKTYVLEQKVSSYTWNFQKSGINPLKASLKDMAGFVESSLSIPGEPLFKVTVTHCGNKSCLGVSISHCLVDGYSYFMFLTSWASRFWGKDYVRPFTDRNILNPKKTLSSSPTSDEIFLNTGLAFSAKERPNEANEVIWETFDFTNEEIDKIYRATSSEAESRLSKNDVITAYVWKKFLEDHHLVSGILNNSCAYDYRRIFSKIDGRYFGNAIRCASFQIDSLEFRRLSLAELAKRVSSTIKAVNEQSIESSLECLETFRLINGLGKLNHFHVADPDCGFLVTNLSKLPVHQLNFGLGTPLEFRILTPAKRTAVLLPLPGDGVRVQIAL